jgi:hypothetical protein
MAFYKRTVVPDPVIPCNLPNPRPEPLKNVGGIVPGPLTTYSSPNWAGFDAAFPSNSNAMVGVEGDYYQPTNGYCSCRNPHEESTWVGLGGGYGGDEVARLIQAGTAINETYTNGNNPTYAGFYEWLNGTPGSGSDGAIEIANLGLSAGDAIYVLVEYDQSSSEADFYVADNTTGNFGPPAEVAVSNAYYDGSTAEWVFERPECNDGCGNYSNGADDLNLFNLPNIGTGEFYTDGGPGAEALLADGDWETLGTLNSDGDVNKFSIYESIQGGGLGSAMLSTSTIHSDGESFAETWHLCE